MKQLQFVKKGFKPVSRTVKWLKRFSPKHRYHQMPADSSFSNQLSDTGMNINIISSGDNKVLHNAIFYKAARFLVSEEGTFWYSETPDNLKGQTLINTKAEGKVQNPNPLMDTFRVRYPDHRNAATFHGYRRFFFRFKLDYIFVPATVSVHDAQIIQMRQKRRYPSDHFPLFSHINLPETSVQQATI